MSLSRVNLLGLLAGLLFGFTLAGARLTDYDVIHGMLRLQDWQPYLIMGSAVGTAAPLLWLLQRRRWRTPFGGPLHIQPAAVERRHIAGSVMFGTGWAIAGTCPGPALAMTGSGRVLGLIVVAGLFIGIALRDSLATRAATRAATSQPAPGSEPLRVGL